MTPSRRIGHIQLPLDFDEADDWTCLGDDGQLLFTRALTYAARTLTDGYVSDLAVERLCVRWPPKRRRAAVGRIVDAGRWAPVSGGGWQVAEWGAFALTSAQVEDFRRDQSEKAKAGGLARSASAARDDLGRMIRAAPEVARAQPVGLDPGWTNASPIPMSSTDASTVQTASAEEQEEIPHTEQPVTTRRPRRDDGVEDLSTPVGMGDDSRSFGEGAAPSTPVSALDPSGTGIRIGRRGKLYDATWPKASEPYHNGWLTDGMQTFRLAWEARGFKDPPTAKQWGCIRDHYREDPDAVAALVRDAPSGLQSNQVMGHVFRGLSRKPSAPHRRQT